MIRKSGINEIVTGLEFNLYIQAYTSTYALMSSFLAMAIHGWLYQGYTEDSTCPLLNILCNLALAHVK